MCRTICWLKIPTSSWVLLFILLSLSPSAAFAQAEDAPELRGSQFEVYPPWPQRPVRVVGVEISGLKRTERSWLEGYLGYKFPTYLRSSDAARVRRRLLTTSVFTKVEARLRPLRLAAGDHVLEIKVVEKWTFVPVVRAVYGGGTPLLVAGAYDIHSFGRLWTFGAEARRYGNAPPGFVAYFRDPRAVGGKFYIGGEFWRSFRIREFYNDDGDRIGELDTNKSISRVRALAPLGTPRNVGDVSPWRWGLDVRVLQEAPATFRPDEDYSIEDAPESIDLPKETYRQVKLLPTIHFDNVEIDNVLMDGPRLIMTGGPMWEAGDRHGAYELQAFYYKLFRGWNFAAHFFLGSVSSRSLDSQYFLGGFDSVRGLPDGQLFGSKASYTNLEVRRIFYRAKFLHLQGVSFVDAGGAGLDWQAVTDSVRSAGGLGLRFVIPQVYRLAFRIDYAWSMDGKTQGISAGMNQFFQPYRPL